MGRQTDGRQVQKLQEHPTYRIKARYYLGLVAYHLGKYKNAILYFRHHLKDVPENITYVGVPARKIESRNLNESFNPYGISKGVIDDPNKKSIHALFKEIYTLNQKVDDLKKQVDQRIKLPNEIQINQESKGKPERQK